MQAGGNFTLGVWLCPASLNTLMKYLTETLGCGVNELTLKTGVPECFPTETFVILHSVDDDRPTKYVREDKNVGLLQAGSRL